MESNIPWERATFEEKAQEGSDALFSLPVGKLLLKVSAELASTVAALSKGDLVAVKHKHGQLLAVRKLDGYHEATAEICRID